MVGIWTCNLVVNTVIYSSILASDGSPDRLAWQLIFPVISLPPPPLLSLCGFLLETDKLRRYEAIWVWYTNNLDGQGTNHEQKLRTTYTVALAHFSAQEPVKLTTRNLPSPGDTEHHCSKQTKIRRRSEVIWISVYRTAIKQDYTEANSVNWTTTSSAFH